MLNSISDAIENKLKSIGAEKENYYVEMNDDHKAIRNIFIHLEYWINSINFTIRFYIDSNSIIQQKNIDIYKKYLGDEVIKLVTGFLNEKTS